jgi:uncharacterized protein (TIGR02231 family)
MNLKHIVLNIFLFAALISQGQHTAEVKSEVKRVIVYTNGAQIEQEATVSLGQGNTVVSLIGLSPYIKEESIRMEGDGQVTILNIQTRNDFLNEITNNKEITSLRARIETLGMKIEDTETRQRTLRDQLDFLNANKTVTGRDKAIDPETLKALAVYYNSQNVSINSDILKSQRELRELNKEMTQLKNQLNELDNAAALPSGTIIATLDSKSPRQVKLRFSYLVDQASWTPSYDIRFTAPDKPVSIIHKANLKQFTGIDWKNAQITLSTAKTNQSARIPELTTWHLGFYEPDIYTLQGVELKYSLSEVVVMDKAKPMATANEEGIPATILNRRLTSDEFVIQLPQDIPSGSETHTIRYRESQTNALFEYQSVPKLSENVYLIGRIPGWAETGLLDGDANLYLENSFVGKTMIDTRQWADTMLLSFGIDNNISIKRTKSTELTENQTLGTNRKETRGYKIQCRNNKTYPVTVHITDQIPVSVHEDITVDVKELSGGTLDGGTGFVKWKIDLNAGASKELLLRYTVKYPGKKKVIMD